MFTAFKQLSSEVANTYEHTVVSSNTVCTVPIWVNICLPIYHHANWNVFSLRNRKGVRLVNVSIRILQTTYVQNTSPFYYSFTCYNCHETLDHNSRSSVLQMYSYCYIHMCGSVSVRTWLTGYRGTRGCEKTPILLTSTYCRICSIHCLKDNTSLFQVISYIENTIELLSCKFLCQENYYAYLCNALLSVKSRVLKGDTFISRYQKLMLTMYTL